MGKIEHFFTSLISQNSRWKFRQNDEGCDFYSLGSGCGSKEAKQRWRKKNQIYKLLKGSCHGHQSRQESIKNQVGENHTMQHKAVRNEEGFGHHTPVETHCTT